MEFDAVIADRNDIVMKQYMVGDALRVDVSTVGAIEIHQECCRTMLDEEGMVAADEAAVHAEIIVIRPANQEPRPVDFELTQCPAVIGEKYSWASRFAGTVVPVGVLVIQLLGFIDQRGRAVRHPRALDMI